MTKIELNSLIEVKKDGKIVVAKVIGMGDKSLTIQIKDETFCGDVKQDVSGYYYLGGCKGTNIIFSDQIPIYQLRHRHQRIYNNVVIDNDEIVSCYVRKDAALADLKSFENTFKFIMDNSKYSNVRYSMYKTKTFFGYEHLTFTREIAPKCLGDWETIETTSIETNLIVEE